MSDEVFVPLFADPEDWKVTHEMLAERARQREIGYTPEHDDEQGPAHVVAEAYNRLGHMGEVANPASVRATLVEVGALVVAAIEAMDRRYDDDTVGQAEPVSETAIICSDCGKQRTNEPDYTPLQAMLGQPLGWYDGSEANEGQLCPDDIAKLMSTANRSQYVGWKQGDPR